jgi:CBS domain-containing protein
MIDSRSATPLIALDAVVIDTETTGLDPRTAWAVEIAAVRISGGRFQPAGALRRLIRPGDPIPSLSTQIHGLDEAAIADAPTFAESWPALAAFIGDAVVIGHALGFDLAVLQRECERAGIAWKRPRTLDTRLLAEVAEPNLAGFSLDSLAAWLGVEITDRHTARGDATACAHIFLALLPKLRHGGIRTLAEAERACRALTDVREEHHRAGWIEPVETPSRVDAERTLRRIDSYAYRHRVRDIMRSPPEFIAAQEPVRAVLARLMKDRISSLYVRSAPAAGSAVSGDDTGIVTERDLLRAVAEQGAPALELPVARFMSRPLATVPADAFVYRAIGRMTALKIRHLGVVDEAGTIVGALSARDLLQLRAGEAIALGDEIDHADDATALAAAWARVPQVAAGLLAEGLSGSNIAAVISRELGALTREAAVIAENRMRANGLGGAPCAFALAVLGSAGRGESLLAMDQDNALLFATGDPGGTEDRWFGAFGSELANILHDAGVPYCHGGVMANNPQWRGSISTWRERIGRWIAGSEQQDLHSVDIFFDLRGVHGDGKLTSLIRQEAFDAAKGQLVFVRRLAEAAGGIEPALGPRGVLKTDQGRIDLKQAGMFGIVTAARALAICHHVLERSTAGRLAAIKATDIGGEENLDALAEAHGILLELALAQQIEDIEQGLPPSNTVLVSRLTKRERERLRTALQAVEPIGQLTRELLFKE